MCDTETPQHGNGSKITFVEFLFFFLEIRGNSFESSELLRDFEICCICFPIFIVEWFPLYFRSVSLYF